MIDQINYKISAKDQKIVIVTADFNSEITEALTNGAMDAFLHNDGAEKDLTIIHVPGAFEIPGTVVQSINSLQPDAVVTLGAVIRGATPHFDFVAAEAARGIADLSQSYDIPIVFGVLTTNNLEQALERAGTKAMNKGWEVMESALKMISIYQQISFRK